MDFALLWSQISEKPCEGKAYNAGAKMLLKHGYKVYYIVA